MNKKYLFQAVWKILDGIGDAIDGTVEEISEFLYQRLVKQGKEEVGVHFHSIQAFFLLWCYCSK